MKRPFAVLLLFASCSFGGELVKSQSDGKRVQVEPASFSIIVPKKWNLLRPAMRTEYPGNVCFPRFECSSGHIDSVVISSAPKTLEEAVSKSLGRLLGENSLGKFVELERSPFTARSGVTGIHIVVGRITHCGRTLRLHRYYFPVSKGRFACIGFYGKGDIDKIVLNTLRTD
jgi:hypothetical protein